MGLQIRNYGHDWFAYRQSSSLVILGVQRETPIFRHMLLNRQVIFGIIYFTLQQLFTVNRIKHSIFS
jgi:hypothetical protein